MIVRSKEGCGLNNGVCRRDQLLATFDGFCSVCTSGTYKGVTRGYKDGLQPETLADGNTYG